MAIMKEKEITDHDQLWKKLIQLFFKEFMELFYPDEAKKINFNKVEFLDKEYFTDVIEEGSRKQLDLVAKVGLKGGGEEFILVHTEFEGKKRPNFPMRMYLYHCQLFLKYRLPIVPIALFTDDKVWREPLSDTYKIGFSGHTYVNFNYRLLKLNKLRYRGFLKSDNPLAFALMAKMGYNKTERTKLKADFLRLICRTKVNDAKKSLLFQFVETYMKLGKTEETQFLNIVESNKNFKEVKEMITTYEQKGLKKGIKQGREEGRGEGIQESLILLYETKFGSIPSAIKSKIEKVSSQSKLRKLMAQLGGAQSESDFKV